MILFYSKRFIIPFLDKRMATGRNDGIWEKTIISITEIGTLNIMPRIPQTAPQKDKPIITTSGLTFKESPVNFGSTKLPMTS